MSKVVSGVILIGSIICGLYVGIWVMFVSPIIEACRCFDAGTLTGMMVGTTVLKCAFAGFVSSIIIWSGIAISNAIDDLVW